MNNKLLILIGCIFIHLPGWPKSADIRIQRLSIQEGLSQSNVNCVFQDSKGYLWLGTQDGLNRYDGYTFRIFNHDPLDTNTLSNNSIHSICEDHSGNLWIATRNGLCILKSNSNKFYTYYFDPHNPNSLSSNFVYRVYVDNDGTVWAKTLESLDKFNPSTHTFTHYKHYFDLFTFMSDNRFLSLYEDHQGKLWVGTKDGLNCFDKGKEQFERFKHNKLNPQSLSNNEVNCIYEDNKYNLWVGTSNGLNKFNRKAQTFQNYYFFKENYEISHNVIYSICEDNLGVLWIGTETGLLKFDPDREMFFNGEEFITKDISLNYAVYSIIQDNSNILWLGTSDGLIKIDRKPLKFITVRKTEENGLKLSSNYISAIHLDKDNHVWLGTLGYGISVYDRVSNQVIGNYSVKQDVKAHTINDNAIHRIFEDSKGDIWVGNGWGISKLDKKANQFIPLSGISSNVSDNFFYNIKVYSICEDYEENLWIGSLGGLHKYFTKSKKLTSFYYKTDDSLGISSNTVYIIKEDKDHNLWIGTDNGLNKYNPRTNKFKHFMTSNKYLPGSISSNIIYSLHIDSNNDLWVGTNNGLNKFDKRTATFRIFTEKDGLPNNVIYSILEDDKLNLWCSTNKGLVRFNIVDYSINKYDVADGLQNYEYNFGASCKAENGELFFGGVSGYNSFFPDSLYKNENIPNIVITSIEIINAEDRKLIPILDGSIINISSNNKFFTIEFAALDFTWPEKNHYAYIIANEREKGQWVNIGNRRYATFSNLPSGRYKFRVKGSNNDLQWNEKGIIMNIIIDAPFWRTRNAYVFYLFVFLLSVYLFFLYRTRSLRMANQILREKELSGIEISKQKEELTVKNKNITDSINYARRIQQAILPSEKLFKKYISSSFIFFKPRDIVSGDFYWVNEKDDKIFVAVADCTGHGVPGAFMSIIGYELLRNITNRGINRADEILNELNNRLVDTFSKDVDDFILKDGMDIAFCVFDKKNHILQFSGAFRPLYLIRDNTITEIKGDRFSVGLVEEYNQQSFKNNIIPLENNDMIYIFSDGYADQFGGAEGKKYKYRRFRHLLLTIHKLPFEKQKEIIQQSIEEWKRGFDQVDDILIIGINPNF